MVQAIGRIAVVCSPLFQWAHLLLRRPETVLHFIPTALRTEEHYVRETSASPPDNKLVLVLVAVFGIIQIELQRVNYNTYQRNCNSWALPMYHSG